MSRPEGYRLPRVQAGVDSQFKDYLPQQVEHCLRLTLERLQLGLKKGGSPISNSEVESLAVAARSLYDIYTDL